MKPTLIVAALLLSVGAYAQTQPTPMKPEMHIKRKQMTPEVRAEFREKQKAKLEAMTPEERKAFFAERKRRHEERLAKMTPEQRQKFEERQRQRKEARKQQG
jgi:periplasmic protein CpxP/Spy